MCKDFLTNFETHESHDEPFIEICNCRPLLMSAYSIVEHQQGCSVEEGINFLRLLSLEVTNSYVNLISVRQQDLGSTKNSITNYSRIWSLFCRTQNPNAFVFVASLNIYCTSRGVILRTFPLFVLFVLF